jgi:hypothetical protein
VELHGAMHDFLNMYSVKYIQSRPCQNRLPFTVFWDKLILLDSGGEALSRINLLVRVASVLMPLKSARPVDALVQQQTYFVSMSERLFYTYSQRPVANEGVSRCSRDLFEGLLLHHGASFYFSAHTYFAVSMVSYHRIFGCGILLVMELLM